jgi:hypothetical protein
MVGEREKAAHLPSVEKRGPMIHAFDLDQEAAASKGTITERGDHLVDGFVIAVPSEVEHTDVGPDVRFLLLNQSGSRRRPCGMEAPPDRGVSGVHE